MGTVALMEYGPTEVERLSMSAASDTWGVQLSWNIGTSMLGDVPSVRT